jgi:hypothetical protein
MVEAPLTVVSLALPASSQRNRFSSLRRSDARVSHKHAFRTHCIALTQQNGVVRLSEDGVHMAGSLAVRHCSVEGVSVGRVCRRRELCRAPESTHALPSLSWFDGDHPIGGCGRLVTLHLRLAMPDLW